MNLADLRSDIADILGTVTDLRVYETVPDVLNVPAAVVSLSSAQRVDYQSGQSVATELLLLESRADSERSQTRLDALLESVLDAIDNAAADIWWTGWEGYAATYTIADVPYVGVQVNVQVLG